MPQHPEVRRGLLLVLLDLGRFEDVRQAAAELLKLKRSDDAAVLGLKFQMGQCDRLAGLDRKLTAWQQGGAAPTELAERLAIANMCQRHKRYYATAARLFASLFAADRDLADHFRQGHRDRAVRAAVLAAAGRGATRSRRTRASRPSCAPTHANGCATTWHSAPRRR